MMSKIVSASGVGFWSQIVGAHAVGKSTIIKDLKVFNFQGATPVSLLLPSMLQKKSPRKCFWRLWSIVANNKSPELMHLYKQNFTGLPLKQFHVFDQLYFRFAEAVCAGFITPKPSGTAVLLEGGAIAKLIFALSLCNRSPTSPTDVGVASQLFSLLPKPRRVVCITCDPIVSLQRAKARNKKMTKNIRVALSLGIAPLDFQKTCNDWSKWVGKEFYARQSIVVDTTNEPVNIQLLSNRLQ